MQKTTPECMSRTLCSWPFCCRWCFCRFIPVQGHRWNRCQAGNFFQMTHMARFGHDAAHGIMLKGDIKGSECKFWIHDLNNRGELEETIRRSLRLKHNVILKPILCSESEELSKSIAACNVYQETFVQWISTQQVKSSGNYLSDEEKSMII